MPDYEITFGVRDEGVTAYFDRLKAEATAFMAQGSGTAWQAGVPESAFGKGERIPGEPLEDYKRRLNDIAEATDSASEAHNRFGINLARTIRSLIVFEGIYKTVYYTIQLVNDAIRDTLQYQTLNAQFANLSTNAKTAAKDFDELATSAASIGQSPDKWIQADVSLQAMGHSAKDAAQEVKILGQYSEESGIPLEHLAAALEKVQLTTGSVEDMFAVLAPMGEAANPLRERVKALQEEEIWSVRINEQIERKNQLNERGYEAQTRDIDRSNQLQERAYELGQKQIEVSETFSDKIGATQEAFQHLSRGDIPRHLSVVGVDVTDIEAAEYKRLEAGEKQIEIEKGLHHWQVRRFEQSGFITAKDLEEAARRQEELQHTAVIQKQQDDAFRRESDHIATINTQQDAAYTRKMKLEQDSLTLNKDIAAAYNEQLGLVQRIGAEQATLPAKLKVIGETIRHESAKYLAGGYDEYLKEQNSPYMVETKGGVVNLNIPDNPFQPYSKGTLQWESANDQVKQILKDIHTTLIKSNSILDQSLAQ